MNSLLPTHCTIRTSSEERPISRHCHSERQRRISRDGSTRFFASAQNDKHGLSMLFAFSSTLAVVLDEYVGINE